MIEETRLYMSREWRIYNVQYTSRGIQQGSLVAIFWDEGIIDAVWNKLEHYFIGVRLTEQ